MAIANRFGILGFDRLAQNATITANVTPTAGFPLTNLQNLRLFSTMRTTTTTGVEITLDLGASYSLNGAALVWNPTTSATWRVRTSTVSNFASTVADSGTINAITSGHPLGYRQPWGTPTFVGFDTGTARYVRFTLNDSSNPAGSLIVSIPGVGKVWTPAIAPQYMGQRPLPDLVVGAPGTEKFLRGHSVSWHQLTHAERAELAEIMRTLGTSGRVFVIPTPNERDQHIDELFWGRFETQLEASLFLKKTGTEWWSVSNLCFREVDE